MIKQETLTPGENVLFRAFRLLILLLHRPGFMVARSGLISVAKHSSFGILTGFRSCERQRVDELTLAGARSYKFS